MNERNRGILRWADRWLVAMAMAALALAIEWLVVHRVRRGAGADDAGRSRRGPESAP